MLRHKYKALTLSACPTFFLSTERISYMGQGCHNLLKQQIPKWLNRIFKIASKHALSFNYIYTTKWRYVAEHTTPSDYHFDEKQHTKLGQIPIVIAGQMKHHLMDQ